MKAHGHRRGDVPRQLLRSTRAADDTRAYGPADDPMLPVSPSTRMGPLLDVLAFIVLFATLALAWVVTA